MDLIPIVNQRRNGHSGAELLEVCVSPTPPLTRMAIFDLLGNLRFHTSIRKYSCAAPEAIINIPDPAELKRDKISH